MTNGFFGVGGLINPGLLERACGSISLNEVPTPFICRAVLSKGKYLSSFFFYVTSSTFVFLVKTFSFNFITRGTSFRMTKFRNMFWPKKYALISKLKAMTAIYARP
jgi:hypothetical protein